MLEDQEYPKFTEVKLRTTSNQERAVHSKDLNSTHPIVLTCSVQPGRCSTLTTIIITITIIIIIFIIITIIIIFFIIIISVNSGGMW